MDEQFPLLFFKGEKAMSTYARIKQGKCSKEAGFAVQKRKTDPSHRVKRPVQVQFKYGRFRRDKSARKNV